GTLLDFFFHQGRLQPVQLPLIRLPRYHLSISSPYSPSRLRAILALRHLLRGRLLPAPHKLYTAKAPPGRNNGLALPLSFTRQTTVWLPGGLPFPPPVGRAV